MKYEIKDLENVLLSLHGDDVINSSRINNVILKYNILITRLKSMKDNSPTFIEACVFNDILKLLGECNE